MKGLSRFDASGGLLQYFLAIVRVESIHPQTRVLDPVFGTEPKDLFDLRADVLFCHLLETIGDAPDVHDGRDLLEERSISRLEISSLLLATPRDRCDSSQYIGALMATTVWRNRRRTNTD
jgi:hypothetical protein